MILEILWFLSGFPQAASYNWATSWLPFIAVLLLGLYLFMPALR